MEERILKRLLLKRKKWALQCCCFAVSMKARLVLLMVVFTLLVSGKNQVTMGFVGIDPHPPSRMLNHQMQLLPPPSSSWRDSFHALFASKRKVPNTSDPLHNR